MNCTLRNRAVQIKVTDNLFTELFQRMESEFILLLLLETAEMYRFYTYQELGKAVSDDFMELKDLFRLRLGFCHMHQGAMKFCVCMNSIE